ncbi:Uncharacterised protein [Halioglobus japonicus]|nr:Uncharacterised protein [Halioglobus japonicus]
MKRVYSWPLLFLVGLIPIQSFSADNDDYFEQIEDATGEPLQTNMSYYADRKLPPMRLTVREQIEWGEFDDTDVTMFRTTATGAIDIPITKKYFAEVSTTVGITNTNFSGDGQFIDTGKSSGAPWKDLYEFSLRYRSQYLINDDWGLVFAGWMVSRWEEGAGFNDGARGAGATGFSYKLGDNFNFVAGVAVSSKLIGNGVSVSPFGQFSWKIDERHTFSTSGLGLQLRTKWSDVITSNVYAKYTGRRWRLDDHNDGVVSEGSLRDRRVPIGVGLQWKFSHDWQLRGDLGVVAYRQLKTTDDDGDTVDTVTSNAPGVFGSLQVRKTF